MEKEANQAFMIRYRLANKFLILRTYFILKDCKFVSVGYISDSKGHIQKNVALCDIAKIEKLQIFVLFENEASNEDFFAHKCFKLCYGYFV